MRAQIVDSDDEEEIHLPSPRSPTNAQNANEEASDTEVESDSESAEPPRPHFLNLSPQKSRSEIATTSKDYVVNLEGAHETENEHLPWMSVR